MAAYLPEDVWWYHVVPYLDFQDVIGSHWSMWRYPQKNLERDYIRQLSVHLCKKGSRVNNELKSS